MQLLERSQKQTDDPTPWWPAPRQQGTPPELQYPGCGALWARHSVWTYLQNSMLKYKRRICQGLFVCMNGAGDRRWGGCCQFALLIMDRSQSPYNHPGAAIPNAGALSLKPSHAHVHSNKSCPAFCSGRATIVCLVQLHLKWQRPRATGGIKQCVQHNATHNSCQRGCYKCCLSLLLPNHSSFLFVSLCSWRTLGPHLLPSSYSSSLIPLQPTVSAGRCPGKLSPCLASRGVKVACWWVRAKAYAPVAVLCMIKDMEWYLCLSPFRPTLPVTVEEEPHLCGRFVHRKALSVCRSNWAVDQCWHGWN